VRRGCGDPVERTQSDPHDRGAGEEGGGQPGERDDEDHQHQLRHGAGHRAQRQSDHDVLTVRRLGHDHPVLPEVAAEVDGRGPGVGRELEQRLVLRVGDRGETEPFVEHGAVERVVAHERHEGAWRDAGAEQHVVGARAGVAALAGRRHPLHTRARGGQLAVELAHERRLQRDDAHGADDEADRRQQGDDADDQAAAQGPRAGANHQFAAFST
jgi:hypothetical protein